MKCRAHFQASLWRLAKLFADDCLVYTAVRTTEDETKLNTPLAKISDWYATWRVQINATEMKRIAITLKKQPLCFDYDLTGYIFIWTDCMKFLGVTFAENFNVTYMQTIYAPRHSFRQFRFL